MRVRIAKKKIASSFRKGNIFTPRNCYRLLYQRRRNAYKRLAEKSKGWMRNLYIHKYCSEMEIHSEVGEQIDRIAAKVLSKKIIKQIKI